MRIIVVGGVAAGMSAAARARRLSEAAEIIVIEKTQHVSFANCGLPYHLGDVIENRDALLLQTPRSLANLLNLDVRVEQEVTQINPGEHTVRVTEKKTDTTYILSYDKLILCPGAKPVMPDLSGIDNPAIHTLRNIEDMDAIKQKIDSGIKSVLVVGGGYIGLEAAENFREIGLNVHLVEHGNQVMSVLDREMTHDIHSELSSHGVDVRLGYAAKSFENANGSVDIELDSGESLTVDMVLMAVGVRPDTRLLQGTNIKTGSTGGILVDAGMQTSEADIYAAGDAVEVKNTITGEPSLIALAGPANRQGRIIADRIFGKSSQYDSTQGTAILQVFDLTIAATGASEKQLKAAEIPFEKIYIHPQGHAGYYPGTNPMHFKLLFAPVTGKILGAQIVGYDGVDKRIDVIATAIRTEMSVSQLEDLELAYAPPYGAAKDPINIAGFVACNLLEGVIDFWYPEEKAAVTPETIIVDVRDPDEFSQWHIEGSVNIPLREIRTRLSELVKDRPVFLYCSIGFRSYLAHRILIQSGFQKVKTLAGGARTYRCFQ